MTAIAQLDIAIFDAPDIDRVGSFYAELNRVGGRPLQRRPVRAAAPNGEEIEFQRAPDHVAPEWPGQVRPQQFHLDLQIDDHQAAAERAVGLGATRLADGASWVTLADPAGHPFDLCQADGVGPVMSSSRSPSTPPTRPRWPTSTPTSPAWRSPTTVPRAR